MTNRTPSANTNLRAELQAVLDEMARVYSAQDAAACAALFTADAALYSPYAAPTHGRAEIEALHRVWTAEPSAKRFEILDLGGEGNLAWALVSYSEGAVTADGTTLAVFERSPNAGWLVRICSLNETSA